MRIVAGTFIQAGWGVSWGKVQLNDEIEFLGLSVDAEGAGSIHCSAVRSLGMRHDISAQQKPAGAGRAPTDRQLVSGKRVERLVGRMGHLAQIEPAAGVHMPGLYTMERVTRPPREGDHGRRRRPGKLAVWGETPAQERYQQALAWWDAAFERGLQVPLAPELTFPGLDEPGVLAAFTMRPASTAREWARLRPCGRWGRRGRFSSTRRSDGRSGSSSCSMRERCPCPWASYTAGWPSS